jgi:hypothetical protein
MKCPECNGKGTVEVPDYRTNCIPPDLPPDQGSVEVPDYQTNSVLPDQGSVKVPDSNPVSPAQVSVKIPAVKETSERHLGLAYLIILTIAIVVVILSGWKIGEQKRHDSTHQYIQYDSDRAPLH